MHLLWIIENSSSENQSWRDQKDRISKPEVQDVCWSLSYHFFITRPLKRTVLTHSKIECKLPNAISPFPYWVQKQSTSRHGMTPIQLVNYSLDEQSGHRLAHYQSFEMLVFSILPGTNISNRLVHDPLLPCSCFATEFFLPKHRIWKYVSYLTMPFNIR